MFSSLFVIHKKSFDNENTVPSLWLVLTMILYHKNTKTATPSYQNCGFCLAEKERFSSRSAASHLANIVVSVAFAWHAPDTPYLLTRSASLLPPPAALASLPLAGARVQIFSDPPTKKAHLGVPAIEQVHPKRRAFNQKRYNISVLCRFYFYIIFSIA